jgi:hypothetical protein
MNKNFTRFEKDYEKKSSAYEVVIKDLSKKVKKQ